jgi:8-oxo-dGTP pyrophosphatase MutT (NUDIX family)
VASALRSVPRPIDVDARVMPRHVTVSEERVRMPAPDAPTPRRAATLLLLYPGPDGELSIPLTVRQPDLRAHAGEVSLPGGAVDETDASPRDAALREAWEEVGVPPASVRLLGTLDAVWIPVSNFQLRPFVGALDARPELVPHTAEVAAIVELPARLLLGDEALVEQLIEGEGWALRAGAYLHADQVIWGATARTLAMFATVLRHAIAGANTAGANTAGADTPNAGGEPG